MTTETLQTPVFQVLVAMQNDPGDDPNAITSIATPVGTLGANNVWTDITRWCENLQTSRGRQHELNSFEAGTATIGIFASEDGRFNPWNTSGPYFGFLDLMVPVQIRATIGGTVYPILTGQLKKLPVYWPDGVIARAEIDVTDAFAFFQAFDLYTAGYETQVLADTPAGYWQLAEPPLSTVAIDSSGNNNPGAYTTTGEGVNVAAPTLGAPGLLAADITTSMNSPAVGNGGGYMYLQTTATTCQTANSWTVEAWFSTTNTASSNLYIFDFFGFPSAHELGILVDLGLISVLDNTNATFAVHTFTNVADGNPHHVALTNVAGGWTLYLDGATLASGTWVGSITDPGYIAWGGFALDPSIPFSLVTQWAGNLGQGATYAYAMTAAQVLVHAQLGALGATVELSGARINRLLNVAGWSSSARSVNAGDSLMAGSEPSLGTSVLSYLQTVEQSELGYLFMNAYGSVQFLARQAILVAPYTTASATFGDGTGELPYEANPNIAFDDLDLWNNIVMQRTGGLTQLATSPASVLAYGPRTFTNTSMLLTTDAEVADAAFFLLYRFVAPLLRVAQLTIRPNNDQTGATTLAVLGLELLDRVTVNRHNISGGGSIFTSTGLLEGINHTIDFSTYDWQVSIALSPADGLAVWILGDTVAGVLGSTTALGY